MKIYFLSSLPCALTVNDAYFGVVNDFERFAEIELSDSLFLRFTPESAQPVCFFLTENIRFQPPRGCEVYLLPDGLAIYAKDFPPDDCTLRPITQAREGDTLASVFMQGNIQFSLQTGADFFVDTLPRSFSACEIAFERGLIFLRSPTQLAIYTRAGARIFLENVLDYELDGDELLVTLPLAGAFCRTARCRYALTESGCERTQCTLSQPRAVGGSDDPAAIRDELLPYAFFESVLIGANYEELLSDGLRPDARKLRAFLGDFIAVTPTRETEVCGLIRKKGERLFSVDYYTVKTENGKITDIVG